MSAEYENFMERLKQLEAEGKDPAKLSVYREMANAVHKAEMTGNPAHLERVAEIAEHEIAKISTMEYRMKDIQHRIKVLRRIMWTLTAIVTVGFVSHCLMTLVAASRGDPIFALYLCVSGVMAAAVVAMVRTISKREH